jgi:2-polyprenyl-6-methoxyphenol hydroxylase-like FAD-dependent oxidoreductase
MAERLQADVVVVGAGPVGLTLAMDLAWRGIDVVVLESRGRFELPSVRSNHVAARSMEVFRRLGVAQKVRNAGLPADYPNDVAYRTSFLGRELARIKIPCRAERYTSKDGPDTGWPTPEPPHRINQIYLEPILLDHLSSMPAARVLSATSLLDFEQGPESVIALAQQSDTGRDLAISCKFLVGCDGGRSTVRKKIGAALRGDAVLQHVQSSFIRAPKLLGMLREQGGTPAWGSFALNPRQPGNVYAIDGRETWLVHVYLNAGVTDFEAVDRDGAIRTVLGVDSDFEYQLLGREDWIGRRLTTDKARDRRVFICGDACHLWVPYGGYGMNAGIADAANLARALAAHLEGWAGEAMLAAYEAERLPITDQVSHFAMNHAHAMAKERKSIPPEIEADGPQGDAVRARIGKSAYDLNVQQYCCAGLNFGYFYPESPIIAYDGEAPPPYTMGDFTPSTVPGARMPHLWLADGGSLYDALGPHYTLLRLQPDLDISALTTAAAAVAMPLSVLDISKAALPEIIKHRLLLVRSDQHIAWRGNEPPADSAGLVDILRGAHRTVNGDG